MTAIAIGTDSLPVSATQPPTLTMNANVNRVPSSDPDAGGLDRPELLGAAAIGLYALIKARNRRIV